jgi:hypothetical protein
MMRRLWIITTTNQNWRLLSTHFTNKSCKNNGSVIKWDWDHTPLLYCNANTRTNSVKHGSTEWGTDDDQSHG